MRPTASRQGVKWSIHRCKCNAFTQPQCVCNVQEREVLYKEPGCEAAGLNGIRSSTAGQCGRTYRQCLKKRGVDLKENGVEMKKQIHRNLTGLFSKANVERLYIGRWDYKGSFIIKESF